MPLTTPIDVGADGATLTRFPAYYDDPKTGTVYITTTGLFDVKTSRTTYATFRKVRAVELLTDNTLVRDYTDAQH